MTFSDEMSARILRLDIAIARFESFTPNSSPIVLSMLSLRLEMLKKLRTYLVYERARSSLVIDWFKQTDLFRTTDTQQNYKDTLDYIWHWDFPKPPFSKKTFWPNSTTNSYFKWLTCEKEFWLFERAFIEGVNLFEDKLR